MFQKKPECHLLPRPRRRRTSEAVFTQRGYRFEIGREELVWSPRSPGNQRLTHRVEVNGIFYSFFDGNAESDEHPAGAYIENLAGCLNDCLQKQGSSEFFLLMGGHEFLWLVLVDEPMKTKLFELGDNVQNYFKEF